MHCIADSERYVWWSIIFLPVWLIVGPFLAAPVAAQPSIMQRAILQGQSAARDSAQKYYVRAAQSASEGRYGPAISDLRKAMEFLPNEHQLKVDMAVLLAASGDRAAAVRELEPVANKPDPYGPAVIQLGDFRLAEGDTAGATAHYLKLITGSDPFPPALLRMGDIAQDQGRREDAARSYRQAVRADSTFIEAWLSLGSLLVVMDRYTEALRAFDRAVQLDSLNELARRLRSLARQRRQDYDEGVAAGQMRARIIVAQTRQEAEDIRRRLVSGADFIALATKHSTDPTSEVGGDLGFFGEGEMIPVFEQAVRQLQPGQISPILQLPAGFAIIMRVN